MGLSHRTCQSTMLVGSNCFEIWAMLKAQIPFLMTRCFDPEPTIFFNNFGNHQNRIWKKPCKFEQEMLSHKGNPATVCTWRYFSRSAHQTISWYDRSVASEMGARGGSGVTCFDRHWAGSGSQLWVDGPDVRSCFWEARWRRRGSYSCFSRSVNYMFFPNHSTQLISGMEQHEESQYVERSPVFGGLRTH